MKLFIKEEKNKLFIFRNVLTAFQMTFVYSRFMFDFHVLFHLHVVYS